ncbi:MAG TPA: MmgE/PrpD family protein [Usitatibacter sp.]|nr:MmgE/PrpD family protein [Usitatibacter sp.]
MRTTQVLAEYVHALDHASLPRGSIDAVARCVLDLVACAAAGLHESGVAAARKLAATQYPGGPAEVWFTAQRATASGAVFANSTAAMILDWDDGFRTARGHPGAGVIPAALAAAAETGASGAEVVAAIVAGYEVSVRVGRAKRWYTSTGTWSPHGAIAAAGRIRQTPPEQLAHALAMATQCAPVLKGKGGSQFDQLSWSDVKEGIAWGALTGMTSLYMAEGGATGALEILDSERHYEVARITEGLGGTPLVAGTYFKPYACCRHVHAPLDAFDALLATHAIDPADIESVEVHTYSGTFNLPNAARPPDYLEVQFSVPYCLAIRALHGRAALMPIEHAVVGDEALAAFAERIMLHPDPAIEARFPAESPTRVVVHSRRGRFESPVTTPRGDPDAPMAWDDLVEKLRVATRRTLSPERQDALVAAVERLAAGDLAPLRAELAKPAV